MMIWNYILLNQINFEYNLVGMVSYDDISIDDYSYLISYRK